MRTIHLFVAAAALLTLVSCSRDPNVVKRRYLESGNRYFDRGKYKEAAIMYADALQKDRLWGPAHYKLGLTWIKTGNLGGAVSELHKAVERLPKGDQFMTRYQAKFGSPVQIYAPYSYDAVYVIVDAIRRAGSLDRAAITAAVATTNYDGLTGHIAFDAKGDLKNGAITVYKVQDGKLNFLSTTR